MRAFYILGATIANWWIQALTRSTSRLTEPTRPRLKGSGFRETSTGSLITVVSSTSTPTHSGSCAQRCGPSYSAVTTVGWGATSGSQSVWDSKTSSSASSSTDGG